MGFGIGIVIGTGIFTLTGVQAKNNAGPAIVISFLVAGVVSLLAALCYAELAAAVPDRGQLLHLRLHDDRRDLRLDHRLGPDPGVRPRRRRRGARLVGLPQEALGLPQAFFGEENSVVNLGAVFDRRWCSAAVAMVGIKESKWVTNALVVIKVSVCLFVIVVGASSSRRPTSSPFVPPSAPTADEGAAGLTAAAVAVRLGGDPAAFGVSGLLVAAAVVFFAYSGFEAVANLGEETRTRPRTCRAGCSARWPSAPCSTSASASCSPGW